jgi:serine/threonine protein kinase
MARLVNEKFGQYRLIRQIATGGMAEIYLAKSEGISGFEKFVALKRILPNLSEDELFITMLIDEAKIAVRLQHANIAQIFDLGRVDDTYYIAMEFIDGVDLFSLLKRASEYDREVPIDIALYIAEQILAGLDYAHRKVDESGRPLGIIHRDVSPQNVLLSRSGEIKLVDFGIAKAAQRSQSTQAGVLKGKYFYMSPEQAWGDVVDHRTDIFSAGIVLYETLVGQMLYYEEDLTLLIERVRRAEIPPPSTVRPAIDAGLDAIIMRALAPSADSRWPTAQALGAALQRKRFLLGASGNGPIARRLADFVAEILPAPDRNDDSEDESADEITERSPNPLEVALASQRHPGSREGARHSNDVGHDDSLIDEQTVVSGPPGLLTDPGGERFDLDDGFDTTSQLNPLLQRALVSDDEMTPLPAPPTMSLLAPPGPPQGGAPPGPWGPSSSPPRRPWETPPRGQDDGLGATGLEAAAPFGLSGPSRELHRRSPLGLSPLGGPSLPRSARPAWMLPAIGGAALLLVVLVVVLAFQSSAAQPGSLRVVSGPPGARVLVDGARVEGVTPLVVAKLDRSRPHQVQVETDGYEPWQTELVFAERQTEMQVIAVLQQIRGTLRIESAPSGAEVLIDGRTAGLTPATVSHLARDRELTVEVRLRGYRAVRRTIRFGDERERTERIPLEAR